MLKLLIQEFVRRVRADPMVGYLFQMVDPDHLAEKEYEFTARFLGADIEYTGRTIRQAHAAHRIMGGQFDRRTQILQNLMEEFEVPAEVRRTWVGHIEKLRPQVTQQGLGICK